MIAGARHYPSPIRTDVVSRAVSTKICAALGTLTDPVIPLRETPASTSISPPNPRAKLPTRRVGADHRRPIGQRAVRGEESPDCNRPGCWVTPRGEGPKLPATESATEKTPPGLRVR